VQQPQLLDVMDMCQECGTNKWQTLKSGITLGTFFCLNHWFTLGKELFLDLRVPSSSSLEVFKVI
jgi:hypothetical protein